MPEMTDEEKAIRLQFYKQQARARWDERDLPLRSFSKPFIFFNRIQLYTGLALAVFLALASVSIGVADHHYIGALAFVAVVASSPELLRFIKRADPASQGNRKAKLQGLLALLLWWALYLGVCAISIAER